MRQQRFSWEVQRSFRPGQSAKDLHDFPWMIVGMAQEWLFPGSGVCQTVDEIGQFGTHLRDIKAFP